MRQKSSKGQKVGTKSQGVMIGEVRIFELRDVAARLGISMNTLRRYVRTGRLTAQKVGVKWMVSEDAIREFFLSPYRPPGKKKEFGT
jgi:excisionase family DNA binding protein